MLNTVTNFPSGDAASLMRANLGLSQEAFWSPLGVDEVTASRYESRQALPQSIQLLLEIAYGPEGSAEALWAALRNDDEALLAEAA